MTAMMLVDGDIPPCYDCMFLIKSLKMGISQQSLMIQSSFTGEFTRRTFNLRPISYLELNQARKM
jgi:hypothetical protein